MTKDFEKAIRDIYNYQKYRHRVMSTAMQIFLRGDKEEGIIFMTHSKESGDKFVKDVKKELERIMKLYDKKKGGKS